MEGNDSYMKKLMEIVMAFGLLIGCALVTILLADFPVLFLIIIALISLGYFWLRRTRRRYQAPIGSTLVLKLVLATMLAVFVGLHIWNIIASQTLARELKQVRSGQSCLTFADLKKAGEYDKIDNYCNGGPLLLACSKMIMARVDEWLEQADIDEMRNVIHSLPQDRPLNDKQYKQIAGLFERCSPFIPIIDQALAQPQLRIALDFPKSEIDAFSIELPHLSVLMNLSRFLTLRVYHLHHNGELEKAVRVIEQMIKIANMLEKEPFLISYLVRIAMHGKACNCVAYLVHDRKLVAKPELLGRLQQIIAPTCSHEYYNAAMAFKSEMIFGYGAVSTPKSVFIGRWLTNKQSEFPNILFVIAPQAWLKDNIAHLLSQQRKFVEVAAAGEQRIFDQLRIWKKPYPVSMWRPLSAMLMPALQSILKKEFEQLTRARCAWAALALRIEQAKSKSGKLPENFDFISKENVNYLSDPFTGKPLHYRSTQRGHMVYGVGTNEKDDHGELTDKKNHNDIGLRLQQ